MILCEISIKFYHKVFFVIIIKSDRARKVTFGVYNYWGSFVQAFANVLLNTFLFDIVIISYFSRKEA